jgi:hypothetical protein
MKTSFPARFGALSHPRAGHGRRRSTNAAVFDGWRPRAARADSGRSAYCAASGGARDSSIFWAAAAPSLWPPETCTVGKANLMPFASKAFLSSA